MPVVKKTSLPEFSKQFVPKVIPLKEFLKMLTFIEESERVKLGHELHDGLAPLLVIAKIYLELVPANTRSEKFAKRQACAMIHAAIENIRAVSSQLVVSQKIECSLVHLLSEFVNRVKGIKAFKVSFRHCAENKLSSMSPEMKIVFFRIVQEQLNNIIKHSKASRVAIRIYCCKGMAKLSILDNGVGFDSTKPAGGIGLANMAMRLKQLNGEMKITSSPGSGCILNILLPLS
jgi:two-component system, NarL family, sensor histidine kinase UhpB